MKNCCDMRGFLTFTALRLISKGPMSGDDLRRELEKRKGSRPSPGTIYPVLKSMSAKGWISKMDIRGKEKNYRITASGRRELEAATEKFISMFCDMKEDFEKSG